MNLATVAATFRKILGHYPTGVCAITAMSDTGIPSAMVVGSFTSVSLDPPLVAFLPDKSSTSWPKIEASGRFCVHVLGANQEELCRVLAAKADDQSTNISYHLSDQGTAIIEGAL